MQRPPELVPIPEYLFGTFLVPPEGFGKLRKVAAFWKNPENFCLNLVKIRQNSDKINFENLRNFGKKQQKIQQFLTKILRLENGAKECIV